jgi:hypothetical protein
MARGELAHHVPRRSAFLDNVPRGAEEYAQRQRLAGHLAGIIAIDILPTGYDLAQGERLNHNAFDLIE